MPSEVYLTTLDNLLAQVGGGDVSDVPDNAIKVIYIAASSNVIQAQTQRSFEPFKATVLYDAVGEGVTPSTLDFDAGSWLLAMTTLTNNDVEITSDQYVLQARGYPKSRVKLLDSSGLSWVYDIDPEEAISVAAVWGYHDDYNNAWIVSGDTVQDDPLLASATTVTVNDADAFDERYRTRFGVGMLIRVGSEYMRIRAIDAGANTLTVTRAINGTVAEEHVQTTAIFSWAPMADIEEACVLLTSWMERQPGSPGEVIQIMQTETRIKSDRLPSFVNQVLSVYAPIRVR